MAVSNEPLQHVIVTDTADEPNVTVLHQFSARDVEYWQSEGWSVDIEDCECGGEGTPWDVWMNDHQWIAQARHDAL